MVSPKYKGPALIRDLSINYNLSNTGTQQGGFLVLVSGDDTGHGFVPYGNPLPSGVPMADNSRMDAFADPLSTYPGTMYTNTFTGTVLVHRFAFNHLVRLPEFFLKVVYACPSGNNGTLEFIMALYEQIDPETVIDLIGAWYRRMLD